MLLRAKKHTACLYKFSFAFAVLTSFSCFSWIGGSLASDCILFSPVLAFLFLLGFDVRWDYLRISDSSNRIVGTYCGYQTGKRISIGGSFAVLKFHTDGLVRYRGFYLSFSFSPRSRGE